jgi:hypothetical protein
MNVRKALASIVCMCNLHVILNLDILRFVDTEMLWLDMYFRCAHCW